MDLPDLVLIQIFKFLKIKDKSNCCKVCRRFNFLIRSIPKENLCIHSGPFPFRKFWASTNIKLDYENSIEISAGHLVNLRFYKLNYSKIKKLYLDNCHAHSYFQKYIVNNVQSFLILFNFIEILEIHSLKLCNFSLQLSQLKILTLKGCMIYNLKIDSPIRILIIWNYFGEIELKDTNDLKFFECDEYYQDVRAYKNLEVFTCRFRNPIDRSLIADLPKLKQLNLFSFVMFPNLLYELLSEKFRLNRLELQISFQGFEVTCGKLLIDQLFFDDQNCYLLNEHNMPLIRDNYEKIIYNIDWSTKLDYSSLEQHFKIQKVLAPDFNFKFKNIIDIEINDKINDYLSFSQFILNCKNIQFLSIKNFANHISNISDQLFFDQISMVLPSLLDLKIGKNSWSINNYKFLDNFKNLMFVELEYYNELIDRSTIVSVLVDFIYNFFKRCKYCKEFVFKKDQLVITLRYLYFYYFTVDDKSFTFDSLENAMTCIQGIIETFKF